MAAAMDHVVEGPPGTEIATRVKRGSRPGDDRGRRGARAAAADRQAARLRLVEPSARRRRCATRSRPRWREARHTGWDGLLADQRRYLDDFWERADVEIDGDAELQQAVRFALFHTLQAGARAERRAIAAKGLTGPGYDGHTFWDTETFVLPVLTYTAPHAAADALRWRHATLELARERARALGLEGAAFPWRTIDGRGVLGLLAGGHRGLPHQRRHRRRGRALPGRDRRRRRSSARRGLELLVETARLWRSLGHHDAGGRFRIDGVTGPDEYSAIADNNVYTNLMAQRNLRGAADAVRAPPGPRRPSSASTPEETAALARRRRARC